MSEEVAATEQVVEAGPTPEQAPAPEPQAQEQQPTEGEQPEEQQPVENKGKERLTQRFSELTAQRRAAEERADAAERELQQTRQQQQSQPQPEGLPDPSQYDDYDQYLQDAIAYGVRSHVAAERRQQTAQAAINARVETAQTVSEKLLQSGLEGAINLVTDSSARVSSEMVDALARSDDPARLADHLGRNLAESARIASLPPHLQGYELAKLESRLASQPRTTNAPPPPNPVGGRATSTADPNKMTMEQYKAARESGAI